MSLNPNAVPWTVPETSMDPTMDVASRVGHQDHRFHQGYTPFYPQQNQHPHAHPHPHAHAHAHTHPHAHAHAHAHPPPHPHVHTHLHGPAHAHAHAHAHTHPHAHAHAHAHAHGHAHGHGHAHAHPHAMPPMMMPHQPPRHMQSHGGFHNPNQMSPLPHNEPVQSYNTVRARPQQYNPGAVNQMQPTMIPSYKQARPFVIVVFGYRRTGKTSVASRISELRGYRYISLKPKDESITLSPAAFVAPLVDILARKNTFDGIVIDDIVLRNKYEPYYVHSILQKHGLKIDMAIFLDNDLENSIGRGIDYDDSLQRQHHPESYEFCASYLQGEPIIVIGTRDKTLEETISYAVSQIGGPHNIKETTLALKEVELMPKCPLERNPLLVTAIIDAQIRNLNLHERAPFPFSEANYLLEYAVFARHAYAFRNYMITPWIQGDKVSLIGYQGSVYIHLPTYNIVFSFTNAPETLVQLAKKNTDENKIGFIFEATFSDGKIYISEMLSLGDNKGSRMLVEERVDLVKEKLKDMNSDIVQLLPWYHVNAIESCESENPAASGILFVNPDGVMFGEYNSRNFLYPLHRKKSVEIRVWNGSFNAEQWTFDAYCIDMEKEVLIEGIPVHISDADVSEHCINDGNILECTREDYLVGTTNKGKKGAKHFVFRRRCNWLLKPTTLYKQEFFVNEPKWPLERMAQACASVKHVPALRPEEPTTADG